MPVAKQHKRCLVIDLGAGSGRIMVAEFDGVGLRIRQIHRFSGYETRLADGPAWDVALITAGLRDGLTKADAIGQIDSVAVDSWGVDFVIVDSDGNLLDQPRTYRHSRGAKGMASMARHHAQIGELTGVQVLPIASVFHLHQWAKDNPEKLAKASRFLMMADYFNHVLSGKAVCDKSLVRTSGLMLADGSGWADEVIGWSGVPRHLFGNIVNAGTDLGLLQPAFASGPNLARTRVLTTAGHDTASAAFALAPKPGEAVAISGSWNLFCAEVPEGFLPDGANTAGFGLEGGVDGKAILTKSLPGLFLLRRLRESWKMRTGVDVDYIALGEAALAASAETTAIVPSDPAFFDPIDMAGAMVEHCPALQGAEIGAFARSLYLGLAREASACIRQLGGFAGTHFHAIRVGGGGSSDRAWMQFLALESRCEIVSGPVEASVVGNALIQLVALGTISSYAQAGIMARSAIRMELE